MSHSYLVKTRGARYIQKQLTCQFQIHIQIQYRLS